MLTLASLLLLALAQDVPPPPVRVVKPPVERVAQRDAAELTLFDGFDAYLRITAAYAAADESARSKPGVVARADHALDAWQRGDRTAAVEGWTRLALELEGTTSDLDLLAAALRLECVEREITTRKQRGFYSHGMGSGTTRVRVRGLFALPELASRSLGDEAGSVTSIDHVFGADYFPSACHSRFAVELDEMGRFAPVERSLQVGPIGHYPLDIELTVAGRRVDRIRIDNSGPADTVRGSEAFRTDWVAASADALRGPRRVFASRLALVVDSSSMQRSAEFIFDAALEATDLRPWWWTPWTSGQLADEAASLREGRSPYTKVQRKSAAPYWRTFAHGTTDIPAWTSFPPSTREGAAPVIIALHEVGFDEGWTMLLAGRGALFRQAFERGFAVLAPANAALEADPGALESLVDALAAELEVDRTRVHLIAPVSAAGLARRLAEQHPGRVASVKVLGADVASSEDVGRVLGLERAITRAVEAL